MTAQAYPGSKTPSDTHRNVTTVGRQRRAEFNERRQNATNCGFAAQSRVFVDERPPAFMSETARFGPAGPVINTKLRHSPQKPGWFVILGRSASSSISLTADIM